MAIKRALSVSLGSSKRDKEVLVELGGQEVVIERRGTDGDSARARALFKANDGKVDAFGVGGIEMYVRVKDREYPLRAGLKLVKDVKVTPAVDGRGLKSVLERRVFELAASELGGMPRYRRAFMTLGADRYGLSEAVDEVSDEVTFGDLMFAFGLPLPIPSLKALDRVAKLLMPVASRLPISMIYPTGKEQEEIVPRFEKWWDESDLIAGDFHYIRRHMPQKLTGKTVVTNTTTEADVNLLKDRGVRWLITSTPRLSGRSFGTNMMEAALTARAGLGRSLSADEIGRMVDTYHLRPAVQKLDS